MLTEPIRVTLLVVEALNALSIPYFVGGSLATAVHGVARATAEHGRSLRRGTQPGRLGIGRMMHLENHHGV